MAKEKDYSDLGFEEETQELPSSAEPFQPMSDKISNQLQAFSGGAQQGLTFGFADELAGATGAALDKGQTLLNKMGLASPSPTQVDEQLKSQGFKGDLQSTMDLYKQLRDAKRQELAQLEEQNPGSFLAGNIGGGLAFSGLGALKSAPSVAKAVNMLNPSLSMKAPVQSLAKLGASGLAIGGATGAGMSKGELLDMQAGDGGPRQVFDDAISGGKTGMMLAPVAGLGVEGIRNTPAAIGAVAKTISKIPIIQDAIDATKGAFQGKTYSGNVQQYQDQLREIGSNAVDMIKELSNKKFEAKTKALEAATKKGDVIGIENSLDDILAKIKILPEDSAEQVTAKTDVLNYIAKLRNGVKETKPAQVIKQEPSLGEYTKIKFNKPEVEKNLEAQIAKLKSLGQNATGQIDQVKTPSGQDLLLPKIISDKPVEGETLQALAPKELMTKKPAVNKVARPDVVIPEQEIVKSLPETQVSPSRLEDLIKRLRDLRPEAPAAKEAQAVVDGGVKTLKKDLEQSIPNLPELNKESHDVQELFKRLTGVDSMDIKSGFDEANTAAVKDRVTGILKKSPDSPAKLQDIIEGFQGVKGVKDYAPDVADYIKKSSEETAKDLRLSELASGQAENTEGVIKAVAGGFGGLAVKGGELAGKAARNISEPIKKAAQDTTGYVKNIASKSPESIQRLAQRSIEKYGPAGEKLAKMLGEAATKSPQTRTAIIFGMMQRPEFRQQLNELNEESSNVPVGTEDEDIGFEE